MIFVAGIVFFYLYLINSPGGQEENYRTLRYEADVVAESLMSEGTPSNWDKNNVIRIGLLSNGKINETKLEYFYEMVVDDGRYAETKSLFRVSNNYYLSFHEPMMIKGFSVDGIGVSGASVENLVKDTRVVVYNNTIRSMNLYLWN